MERELKCLQAYYRRGAVVSAFSVCCIERSEHMGTLAPPLGYSFGDCILIVRLKSRAAS